MSKSADSYEHAKPPKFPWFELIPIRARYTGLAFICLSVSVGGVIRAVHLSDKTEGGRGGAIATMLALTIVLLRRDFGVWQYKDRIENMKTGLSTLDQLTEKVSALEQAIGVNSIGQTSTNWWLAGSTAIGTLFWGFGDVFAKWFIH